MKGSKLLFSLLGAALIGPQVQAESLYVDATGNVAVGTNAPAELFHTYTEDADGYPVTFLTENGTGPSALFRFKTNDPTVSEIDFNKVGPYFRLNLRDGDPWELQLAANGNLTIKGTLITGTNAQYPDYVFKESYELMPISELENFIRSEGHLPNVQSQADVDTQGGVNVSELQTEMLRKIEELTLYTIQQHKQIEALQARLATMEADKN